MTPQWNRSAALYVAMTCAVAVSLSKQFGRNVETLRHFLGSLPISMAGHLLGMSDDRAVKKVFLCKPDGIRRSGRPKSRWLIVLRMI
jgi:hypothetical protein